EQGRSRGDEERGGRGVALGFDEGGQLVDATELVLRAAARLERAGKVRDDVEAHRRRLGFDGGRRLGGRGAAAVTGGSDRGRYDQAETCQMAPNPKQPSELHRGGSMDQAWGVGGENIVRARG